MKRRVLKWPIPIDDQWHEIPDLIGDWHIGQQFEESVTVWAEVWEGKPDRMIRVRVFGTGHEFEGRYLGTVQAAHGLVWHLVQAES